MHPSSCAFGLILDFDSPLIDSISHRSFSFILLKSSLLFLFQFNSVISLNSHFSPFPFSPISHFIIIFLSDLLLFYFLSFIFHYLRNHGNTASTVRLPMYNTIPLICVVCLTLLTLSSIFFPSLFSGQTRFPQILNLESHLTHIILLPIPYREFSVFLFKSLLRHCMHYIFFLPVHSHWEIHFSFRVPSYSYKILPFPTPTVPLLQFLLQNPSSKFPLPSLPLPSPVSLRSFLSSAPPTVSFHH